MTKAEIIESVLLRLSGGRLSADIDVRREDIAVLVDSVIAEVMSEYSKKRLREEAGRLRTFGVPGLDSALEFAVTYTITPVLDEERNQYYLEVPGKIYSGGGKSGLHSVMPIKGNKVYVHAQSPAYIRNLPDMGVVFFWKETVDNTDKIYMADVNAPVCKHLLSVTIKPTDLDDNEELGLPDGLDIEVVRRLFTFFRDPLPQDQELTDTDETRANE